MLPACECMFPMLDEVIPFFGSGSYKYRGHADSSWQLQTSLERVNQRFLSPMPEKGLQNVILKSFKSSAALFFDWKPQDQLEWLSQIQHYGGPTSLLDFTDSFWVALYFAVWPHIQAGMTSDFSVLAIRNWYLPEGLLFHYPRRQNARLLAQQGLFLAKTDHERTIDQILQEGGIDFEHAEVIDTLEAARKLLLIDSKTKSTTRAIAIKYCFPGSANHEVLKYLYQMNITGSSLFPDQSGAIQNLSNEWHLGSTILNKKIDPYEDIPPHK